ncbi:hypothetical protein GIB67_030767 [Kingdonia uniflora]|uniref:Denticleless protein homolog n=1 Tax=Kingdonia uniflora TaxID=39325 RepID=A0A7J7L335_9MAGN|nr:hypothetical protein GIB67_030767 [Kingdonia uniflora]
MATSTPKSFFEDLRTRELNGSRVKKRPHFSNLSSESGNFGSGVVSIEQSGTPNPPLAVSFCKSSGNSHILAVAAEDGYVRIYDTHWKLPSSNTCRENPEEARVCDWEAHKNAIFDIRWIKDDTNLLTASGDQTINVWNVERKKCVIVLKGHTGSVKSLCSHPSNPDLVLSGSRDGSFAFWDLRCQPSYRSRSGDLFLSPTSVVNGAHVSAQGKWNRRTKAASMSITSVLYLKDDISIASAGAVDSVVKFWDTRKLKASITQTFLDPEESTKKEKRLHGISSLSQDQNGVFLTASCMDNRIYLYNMLQLDKGPVSTFCGSRFDSFYVKSAISPDGSHILSGSSDGDAYIWQVKKPQESPITLKGHDGEVTAVDWCSSEIGKIATACDDFTVRVWNIQKGYLSNTRSPVSIRKRVMALPRMERRRLFMPEDSTDVTKPASSPSPSKDVLLSVSSPNKIEMPEITTPQSAKRKISSTLFLQEEFELSKMPEAALDSPSSVLNPPSSKRKTIRDYFVAVS